MSSAHSNVVLMARVDDPAALSTRATYSTIVPVEHNADETLATIAEMAMELAPAGTEWDRY